MYDGYISLLCSRNGQVSDDIYIYPLLVHLIKKTQILDVCRWYHMHSVSRCVIAFFALAVAGAAREQVPRGSTIRPVASIKVYEGEDDGWRESVKTFYSLTL